MGFWIPTVLLLTLMCVFNHGAVEIEDCSSGSRSIFTINSIRLNPDPIKVPGKVRVTASVRLHSTFSGKYYLDLEVQKYIFWGYWHTALERRFTDVCGMLKSSSGCPTELDRNGVPCKCPIKAGTYTITDADFNIRPGRSVPSGDYWAKVVLTDASTGRQVACKEVELSVKKCTWGCF